MTRRANSGGVPARRAVVRWAARLFRRDWRQQSLVLGLLTFAVAVAIFSAATAYNVTPSRAAEFGSAAGRIDLRASRTATLAADLTALREEFGPVEVITHATARVPGSVSTIDVRAQDPAGPYGRSMLAVREGRTPANDREVAVTDDVATTFGVAIGDELKLDGPNLNAPARTVVGLVENPADLDDDFALLAPSSSASNETVTVLVGHTGAELGRSGVLRSGTNYKSEARGLNESAVAAALTLMLATVFLLLICLVATAGFAVVAQRRLRQLGMLAAVGASPRHLRLVMLTNGAVVGACAAVAGAAIALPAWFLFGTRLETAAGHRIDRFDVPWWLIVSGMLLAVLTAVVAAWWPARAAARIPVVDALAGRPAPPKPVHRSALVAAALLVIGVACLATGIDSVKGSANPLLLVPGTIAIVAAVLFLSPIAIRAVAAGARRLPVAPRLALRDLSRHQSRSGAALAAISLGLGIAVSTIVIATAAAHPADAGNLSAHQLLFRVGDNQPVIPERTDAEIARMQTAVATYASTIDGTSVVPLDAAVFAGAFESQKGQRGRPTAVMARPVDSHTLRDIGVLYVATPELLRHAGVDEPVAADVDVLTFSNDDVRVITGKQRLGDVAKIVQVDLPETYGSAPRSFVTTRGMERLELEPARAGWLVVSPTRLTNEQLRAARAVAAEAGMTVEERNQQRSLATTKAVATAAGILLALCILAMTVGLIRGEGAQDLQTLTANGATRTIRRALTATTAGALALLGATLGIAGAYIAMVASYRHDLEPIGRVPLAYLVILVAGVSIVATAGGWVFAGRQPPAFARRALE